MNISEALQIISSSYAVPGQSNTALLRSVRANPAFQPPTKSLSSAPILNGHTMLRPVDALRALSEATAPTYQDDVLDTYLQWGQTKYLGLFDIDRWGTHPALRLSEAGSRIVGNQRRVTSEEMGIGFGVLLGKAWFRQSTGLRGAIAAVDVDMALDANAIYATGSKRRIGPISQTTSRRPDYLLLGNDPSAPRTYQVRALECKGTKSATYAVQQLAAGLAQLESVSVAGRIPAGLAVSTVTADESVSYIAVDPEDDADSSFEVTADAVESVREFELRDNSKDIPGAAAMRASWAMLADFAGNDGAVGTWAPPPMRRRGRRGTRTREFLETPYGLARGQRFRFVIGGQALSVWHAAIATVDASLDSQSAERISDTQAAFASELSNVALDDLPRADAAYSVDSTGSVYAAVLEG